MKRMILLVLFVSFVLILNSGLLAQSVGINADGSSPDGSAMLDVKSTTKGFLAPRVASTGDVASPATGLMVYQTGGTAGYYYYDGSEWVQLGEASGSSQWTTTGSDIYYNSGDVGIGTTTISSDYKLEVNGKIKASHFGLDETSYFQTQRIDGSTEDVVIGCDDNDFFFYERESNFYQFNIGGAAKLRIQADGCVGIGTMTPIVPLDVSGSIGISSAASYFNSGTNSQLYWSNPGTFNVTIRASNDIMAGGSVVATSDKRVKENITDVQNSLDMIGKLRPVSYNKIDKVEQGNRIKYGFIAQEVEEVIPNAVNTGKGEVPVLKPFEKVEFEDSVSYTILVKNGDDIKEQKYTTKDPRPTGEIIVKSKTVDDFKSITYDMIFTVAVDAIQEQQKEIESQNEKLESQQKQIDELIKIVNELKSK
ncbi:MAG: tail fiber domain-containing protein [Candidatus Cloacimonetes bacterium]|nr:tail fiber domain-containing protein [Candidatus Cloacimonadota bacterium]